MQKLDRAALLQEIIGFAATDLLCYRAPANTPESTALRAQQDAAFDPVLDWILQHCGAAFLITDSVMPIAQHAAAIAAVQHEFAAARDAELLALAQLTALFGSALLTLAVWKKFIPIEMAIAAARLDETYQAERYGLDPVVEAKWASTEEKARACIKLL